MLTKTLLLEMANSKRLESLVRRNDWSAQVARQFVAGETLDEAIDKVRGMNERGIAVSLDFLGESVTTEQEVAAVLDTYLRMIQAIHGNNLNANVSVKLTALGLDIDEGLCERNLRRLLKAAGPEGFVRIDMESSAYTERTLALFFRLWEGPEPVRNVGVVIQSYLRRSGADIDRLIAAGARVRLCKGAYKEGSDVAFPAKSDVDANYVLWMQRLLREGNYPGIATHDPKIIEATKQFALDNGIAPDRYEFQMLYGIRRDLQIRLVKEGYNVRVYMPFGTHWYPYLMRRLAERPANLWFVLKNMLRS